MSITLETRLDILHELVDLKQRKDEIKEYDTLHPMFDVILDIIIKKNLICYGGFALNALLPKTRKIYKPKTLPDYDCFSIQAKKDAIEIADKLVKKNYKYVEVKSGLHKGTYKVYAEFKPVADITQVNTPLFKYLSNNSIIVNDIHICPPAFLLWSLYKELCRPEGSGFRWEKVYARYLIFHKHYKFESLPITQKDMTENSTEFDILKEFIKDKQYTVIGHYAVSIHLDKPCKISSNFYNIDILTDNLERTCQEIKELFGNSIEFKKTTNNFKEVISNTINIFYNKTRFCKLYQTDSCYSYQKKNNFRCGTVDTILHLLYGEYISSIHFNTLNGVFSKSLQQIILLLEKYSNNNLSDPERRLRLACTGYERTVNDIKKEFWNKPVFIYRPRN